MGRMMLDVVEEHLDEAVIEGDGTTATAGDNPKQNKSLRRLPDSQLLIGTGGLGLFQLVDPAELERRAWAVVTTADELMAQAEAWISDSDWRDGSYGPDSFKEDE